MIKIIIYVISITFIYSQSFSDIMDEKPLWTGSFGTVSIDGETYNQISLRPEFNVGKWGMGFDFYLYINGNGEIYEDSWKFVDENGKFSIQNTYKTLVDKFRYIRYGYPGDQLYFRLGSLSNIYLGHGILVDNYSNMMRYPEIRQVGLQAKGFIGSGIGLEFIQSNFKDSPSLIGARINYPITSDFDFGVSIVVDINQNSGLKNSDDDDTPDFADAFPENSDYQTDTDGDGLADQNPDEYDIDGDGWDISDFDNDGDIDIDDAESLQDQLDELNSMLGTDFFVDTSADFSVTQDEVLTFSSLKESVTGAGLDFTYHINQNFKFYSEAAILGSSKEYTFSNGEKWQPGYGLIPFGLKGHYGPFSFKLEFRKNSRHFVYNFWNRSYDINRSMLDGTNLITKTNQLYQYGAMDGIYLDLGGNFYNLVNLNLGYQYLRGESWDGIIEDFVDSQNNGSFLANISLNTSNIPKLKYLNGFYQRTNVDNPFNIAKPDQNTVFGYDLGLDFSDGMVLVYKSRTSYEPNGSGGYDKVNSMFIETQILF